MSQATVSAGTATKQTILLSNLRDLLRTRGVRSRLITHLTLRMEGHPMREHGAPELEIYGLGREVAVLTIDDRSIEITLPKSKAIVPLGDVRSPESALRFIAGWATGVAS
ncbi:hypothetical protein [Planotetraspora phitsanulokensis]|nr:hypothetical protein [Planotetraspora phitsanulokensis]